MLFSFVFVVLSSRNICFFIFLNGFFTKKLQQIKAFDDEYNIYCDQKILHQLNQKIIEKFGQTNFTGLIWKSENEITVSKDKADRIRTRITAE